MISLLQISTTSRSVLHVIDFRCERMTQSIPPDNTSIGVRYIRVTIQRGVENNLPNDFVLELIPT
jgi:hypothetical protein